MFTRQITLRLEAGSADHLTHTIESEGLPSLQDQQGFPDQTVPDKSVVTPLPTPISRNSQLVGFERGRMRLQPFVGPKEF
jgi:hypothetical protein